MYDFPNEFLKPKLSDVVKMDDNNLKVVIEPLEMGFGHTLGNALRRTMLSSMPGCAVTEVKISGILHEFTSKNGIYEDIIDILLNLSDICFKLNKKNSVELSLNKKGPCVILASDFILPDDVIIVNPDHIIANIDSSGDLEIDIRVSKGRGSIIVSDKYDFSKKELSGWLQLDAFFSPINKITYEVESTSIESRSDLEKLIMYVDTNGTITASDALHWASKILSDQLSVFIDLKKEVVKKKISVKDNVNPDLFRTIDSLNLTVRSKNCLRAEKIRYVGDLVQREEVILTKANNLGKKSLNEIKDLLYTMNLFLGSKIANWEKIKIAYLNECKKKKMIKGYVYET